MSGRLWGVAGCIFGIASVVMLIATITQFWGYYVKDIGNDDDTTITHSEYCEALEDEEHPNSGEHLGGYFDTYCKHQQEDNYQVVWQSLMSVGLATICLGNYSKKRNEPKQNEQQPLVQQQHQQPPQY